MSTRAAINRTIEGVSISGGVRVVTNRYVLHFNHAMKQGVSATLSSHASRRVISKSG